MHLSFVLFIALNIFAVMGFKVTQSNYDHEVEEGDSMEEREENDPFIEDNCRCTYQFYCPEENRDKTMNCKGTRDVYCCFPENETPWRESVTNNDQGLLTSQQDLSQTTLQFPTSLTSQSKPLTSSVTPSLQPQQLSPSKTTFTPSQPEMQTKLSNMIPTNNQTPKPKPPSPTPTSSQSPITSTSAQHQLPSSSAASPSSNGECVCTPFFRCFDEETSSNLTNLVNDRLNFPSNIPSCQDTQAHKTCSDPNDVCCCNLEKPSEKPKQLKPPTISSSKCEGNCTPANDCPGKDIPSTNSGQGTCTDPDHICCQELVLPVLTQTSNLSPSSNPQPSSPSETSSAADDGCTGSCVPIADCPELEVTWDAALTGDSDAIQKLRNATCDKKDNHVYVCCH